jgi:hypothetical protein
MKLKTRTIWMLAGLAWGLLVGLAVSLQTAAFLFGVGWLFVFGDNPWPAAVGPVVLSLTIIAGLVPAFLLGWIGFRLGIAFESETRQRLRARRRGWTVLAVAVGGAVLGVSAVVGGSVSDRADRADRRAADRQLESLVAKVHRIDAAGASVTGTEPIKRLRIPIDGERSGVYMLEWVIVETLHNTDLDEGTRRLELTEESVVEIIPIDVSRLRDVYREIVLQGRGGALVEEDFEARLHLRPELRPEEAARLPDTAVRNLALGQSDLLSEVTVPVPVRFEIR